MYVIPKEKYILLKVRLCACVCAHVYMRVRTVMYKVIIAVEVHIYHLFQSTFSILFTTVSQQVSI